MRRMPPRLPRGCSPQTFPILVTGPSGHGPLYLWPRGVCGPQMSSAWPLPTCPPHARIAMSSGQPAAHVEHRDSLSTADAARASLQGTMRVRWTRSVPVAGWSALRARVRDPPAPCIVGACVPPCLPPKDDTKPNVFKVRRTPRANVELFNLRGFWPVRVAQAPP